MSPCPPAADAGSGVGGGVRFIPGIDRLRLRVLMRLLKTTDNAELLDAAVAAF